jgi:hypothetical protein
VRRLVSTGKINTEEISESRIGYYIARNIDDFYPELGKAFFNMLEKIIKYANSDIE